MHPPGSLTSFHNMLNYYKLENGMFDKCVEIGCYSGELTIVLSVYFHQVFAIDPWIDDYDDNDIASHANMEDVVKVFDQRTSNYTNITKIRKTSIEASSLFEDNSIDLVYIDGIHTYDGVKNDLSLWIPKVKYFISGYDFWIDGWPGVKKAVLEIVGEPDKIFEGNWIKKIKD